MAGATRPKRHALQNWLLVWWEKGISNEYPARTHSDSQGSKNLFCASRRIFRAEPGCHFSGRIFFHLGRNRVPRPESLGAKKEAIFEASFCTWPDNLVPGLKKSTISTFEHSLVLSKNRTISSTSWENQHISKHFQHKLWKFAHLLTTALSLSAENGYGVCVRSTTPSSKSTLTMTTSHGDISVPGSLTAQREHARFCWSTWSWPYCATPSVLQPLQMLQIYPLLSLEWIWICGLAHHHHLAWCSLDFRSTKGALFEVLSTKSSTKCRKNEGRSKT